LLTNDAAKAFSVSVLVSKGEFGKFRVDGFSNLNGKIGIRYADDVPADIALPKALRSSR